MPKPSPWKESGAPGPLMEEHVFAESAFPPNSIPFITRLRAVLNEAGTNSLQGLSESRALKDTAREAAGWKARALLWVLNAQYFGQLANIDMSKEWDELDKAHKEGKF